MKNSAYWKLRFEQLEAASNKNAVESFATIQERFIAAQKELEQQISTWYTRFAKNNNISMAEAKRLLTTKELAEFKWDVKEFIKYGEQNALDSAWMKQLENASARFHVSRLEALKMQTQQTVEKLFGGQTDALDALLKRNYLDTYYHTAYEIQKGISIGWDIAAVDNRTLERLISKPWSTDGKNFSERIWSNKSNLINEVQTQLTQTIMLGKSPDDAIKAIAKKMGTSKNQAGRLVMTESAYFSSQSQKDCFNELDVEQFEIVATLDSHTSEICQQMDGQVFPMKDFEPGVTAPPFHPWCRSTTVPYFDDNFTERAARGADGKTYYVDSKLNYKDWKQTFVDGGSKDGLKTTDENDFNNSQKSATIKGTATTVQEATKEAEHYANTVSFRGITNVDSLNEYNGTLKHLTTKYGGSKLSEIQSKVNRKGGTWASANVTGMYPRSMFMNDPVSSVRSSVVTWTSDYTAAVAKAQAEIAKLQAKTAPSSYDLKALKSWQTYLKQVQECLKFTRHNAVYVGQEVRSVMTHEYGHVLADQIFGQINHSTANSAFSYNANNPLWQKCQWVERVYQQAIQNGDIYKISKYASKNSHEFFAETFTMYDMGIEPLPDYIVKMIEGVLK